MNLALAAYISGAVAGSILGFYAGFWLGHKEHTTDE